jgi:hypothetical protein
MSLALHGTVPYNRGYLPRWPDMWRLVEEKASKLSWARGPPAALPQDWTQVLRSLWPGAWEREAPTQVDNLMVLTP